MKRLVRFMMRTKIFIIMVSFLVFGQFAAFAAAPPELPLITVEKNYYDQWVEYKYSLDYMHDYGHNGPLFDWHVHLGNWTPSQIEVTPPVNWAGSWDGGTYGAETNNNPYEFGNIYIGSWTIRVKAGYGDGTATYSFTDNLHNVVGYQTNVLGPMAPEPISSILFVTGGSLLAGRRYLKRKKKA